MDKLLFVSQLIRDVHVVHKSLLWRNRLARTAVNRKVGGSSPPRSGLPFGSLA